MLCGKGTRDKNERTGSDKCIFYHQEIEYKQRHEQTFNLISRVLYIHLVSVAVAIIENMTTNESHQKNEILSCDI